MITTMNARLKLNTVLDTVLVAAPVLFMGTTLLLQCIQPGYNPVRDTVSALVWGVYGAAQTVVFVVCGVGIAALAYRLGTVSKHCRPMLAGQVALCIMALGFLVIAAFPTVPPSGDASPASAIHEMTARCIAVVFPVASLWIVLGIPASAELRPVRLATALAAVLGMVLVPAGTFAVLTDASWVGAIERAILGCGLVWMETMGILLVRMEQRETVRHQRQAVDGNYLSGTVLAR